MQAHYQIDVRDQPEPVTLLRVKGALDKMNSGEILKVAVAAGTAADDMVRLINLTGQAVAHVEDVFGHTEIYVKRVERKPRSTSYAFKTTVPETQSTSVPPFPAEPVDLNQPSQVELRFERVLNEMIRVWKYPAPCSEYLNSLVFDTRGDRQGFPPDVLSDISVLEYVSKSKTGEYDHSIEAKLLNNPEYGVD